MQLCRYTD